MNRFFIILLISLANTSFAATHYVWCGSANNGDGTTLQSAGSIGGVGAMTSLPASLSRGDVYAVAGSGVCNYGTHAFSDAESGTTVILVRRVNTSDSGIAGYQASYTTDKATWQDAAKPDPATASSVVWSITNGYYSFDGGTCTTDPTVLGLSRPSDCGIQVISPNPNKSGNGIIQTANVNGINNLSFTHMEYGGIGNMPFYGKKINCSYDSVLGAMTLTTQDGSSFPLISGDKFDGWSTAAAIVFTALVSSNVTGSTATFTTATNYCATVPAVGLTAWSGFTAYGFRTVPAGGFQNFTNISFDHSYFHDASEGVRFDNCINCSITNSYYTNNRSTPQQHSSIIQIGEGQNSIVSGPVYVINNFISNAVGTGVIEHLGQATGCRLACGTINGLIIAGNVFTCTTSDSQQCGAGHYSSGDNAGETCVENSYFINNTVAALDSLNIPTIGGSSWTAACSTGNTSQNNIFYNLSYNIEFATTKDYNTMLNSNIRNSYVAKAHDFWKTSGVLNPFVDSEHLNFKLAADLNLPLTCTPGTKCFPDGTNANSSVNSIDPSGVTRGTGNGWDRGVYQFFASASTYPINVSCAGNGNGTIVGSGGSVINAVCTSGSCTGVCTETLSAGATPTYTSAATSGALTSFSGGSCNSSPCTPTINGPLTLTATFQTNVSCSFTLGANSVNVNSSLLATITTAGLTGNDWFWAILDPININLGLCNVIGCQAGLTGNLAFTTTGTYTCIVCSNGSCNSSTQFLNVNNIGIGGFGH